MRNEAAFAALLSVMPACGIEAESVSSLSPNDVLYNQAVATCGQDGLVVRVVDLSEDEAMCCVTYTSFVPHLKCMTASGATISNPASVGQIKQVTSALPTAKNPNTKVAP